MSMHRARRGSRVTTGTGRRPTASARRMWSGRPPRLTGRRRARAILSIFALRRRRRLANFIHSLTTMSNRKIRVHTDKSKSAKVSAEGETPLTDHPHEVHPETRPETAHEHHHEAESTLPAAAPQPEPAPPAVPQPEPAPAVKATEAELVVETVLHPLAPKTVTLSDEAWEKLRAHTANSHWTIPQLADRLVREGLHSAFSQVTYRGVVLARAGFYRSYDRITHKPALVLRSDQGEFLIRAKPDNQDYLVWLGRYQARGESLAEEKAKEMCVFLLQQSLEQYIGPEDAHLIYPEDFVVEQLF